MWESSALTTTSSAGELKEVWSRMAGTQWETNGIKEQERRNIEDDKRNNSE